MAIGSQLAQRAGQSRREQTKELKLSISIVLQALMEFLRTTLQAAHRSRSVAPLQIFRRTGARSLGESSCRIPRFKFGQFGRAFR